MAAGGDNRWPYLGRNRWPLTWQAAQVAHKLTPQHIPAPTPPMTRRRSGVVHVSVPATQPNSSDWPNRCRARPCGAACRSSRLSQLLVPLLFPARRRDAARIEKLPFCRQFVSGRYWARTSDLLLVRRAVRFTESARFTGVLWRDGTTRIPGSATRLQALPLNSAEKRRSLGNIHHGLRADDSARLEAGAVVRSPHADRHGLCADKEEVPGSSPGLPTPIKVLEIGFFRSAQRTRRNRQKCAEWCTWGAPAIRGRRSVGPWRLA